jgi:hypothetical protein
MQLEEMSEMDDYWFTTISPLEDMMRSHCMDFFKGYTLLRLSTVQKLVLMEDEEEEDIDLEDDVDELDDQLMAVATVARVCYALAAPFLCHLMMTEELPRLKHSQSTKELSMHQERVRWVMVIVTYLIADRGEGEKPLAPRYVLKASTTSSLEQDPVIQLVSMMMQCAHLFLVGPSHVDYMYSSPLMVETLFLFFSRFCLTYLYLDEDEYQQMRSVRFGRLNHHPPMPLG